MPKTVALQHPASRLSDTLAAKGYKVMSLQEAVRFRVHVDAVLYAVRRPDTIPAYHSAVETADISVGYNHGGGAPGDALPGAIMLNITGLHPEQVVAELEQRLQLRPWRT